MRNQMPMAAVDARRLVPVRDEAGGVVVYVGGRAAYYVLNGEWFAALPEPEDTSSARTVPEGRVAGTDLIADQLVSTS
jgi:hypothetical protein